MIIKICFDWGWILCIIVIGIVIKMMIVVVFYFFVMDMLYSFIV